MDTSHDQLEEGSTSRPVRRGLIMILALLTVPAAALALFVGASGATDNAGCAGSACEGLTDIWFGVLAYGAPIVAVLTIVTTTIVKARRGAILVPVLGLAVLIVDIVVLAVSHRG
jgi:hypothetical protein